MDSYKSRSEWSESIWSDVNPDYVSNMTPSMGESLTISVRCFPNPDLVRMSFKMLQDGRERMFSMEPAGQRHGFSYYTFTLNMDQPRLEYSIVAEFSDQFFFYTRAGVTEYHQDDDYNFVLLADADVPMWVAKSVFYQIFPDRFSIGNPDNGVKTSEYEFDGHQTLQADWDDPPREYHEGFCLDFYGGDLPGIEQRLDYLQSIGVNAVYLNPVFEGKTTHRYDCIDYFHVDQHLGGDQALADLVEAAHQRDIKVIVDVSINHTGIEHKWAQKALQDPESLEHRYYYWNEDGSMVGWEGVDTLPQLNHGSPELQQVLYSGEESLVRHFLRKPFKIDGWRFDVGNHTGNRGEDQLGHQVWQMCRQAIKAENPDAYIVGEHWEDAERYLRGDQWDTAMNYFASGRPLRRFIGAMDRFSTPDEDPHRRIQPISGESVWQQIQQHFGRIPNQLTWVQFNLIDSHDIWRLHNNSTVHDINIYRGIIATMFMLPGTMNIYYGDEIGIAGTVETVEGCRYPMRWEESDWDQDYRTLYASLSTLKQEEPALQFGSIRCLFADEEALVLARFTEDRVAISILNRSVEARKLTIPVAEIGLTDTTGLTQLDISGDQYQAQLTGLHQGCLEIELSPKGQAVLSGTLRG